MDEKTEFRAFLLEIVYNLTNHDVKAIKFLINGRVRRCRLDKADSVDLLEILGELGFWSWTKRGPVGLVQFAELCRSVQRMDLSIRIMEYDSAHHNYEVREVRRISSAFAEPVEIDSALAIQDSAEIVRCSIPVLRAFKAVLSKFLSERKKES